MDVKEVAQIEEKANEEQKTNVCDKCGSELKIEEEKDGDEQIVDPFTARTNSEKGIDYYKVVDTFGSQLIEPALLERFEKLTGHKPHPWLRRGYFFSHRDFDLILDFYEQKKPFYLYTGRGPSSDSLHFGHLIPFVFTKWLQDVFNVPLVVQCTDDEKYLWKGMTIEESQRYLRENVKDIIAIGFDVSKTFIFSDLSYLGRMYPTVLKVERAVTASQVMGIFGFGHSHNIGQFSFPAIQATPSFSAAFPIVLGGSSDYPCLIPCAIDQDPYFRMTRDVAPRLGYHKPALIHSKFFPALTGLQEKMSASVFNSAVYLTDTPQQIRSKVQLAFSGGADSLEQHREQGANLEIDIPYQYLTFFLEDDAQLAHIAKEYSSGRMTTEEVKNIVIDILIDRVREHKIARAAVTDDVLEAFMAERPLSW